MKQSSALVLLSAIFTSIIASSQPALDRPLDSNLKAGQLFTVRIVPKSKSIDVFVAGNSAAKFDWADVQMVATFTIGKKRWVVVPGKTDDHFVITRPVESASESKTQLRLKLDHKENDETLEFDLPPRR